MILHEPFIEWGYGMTEETKDSRREMLKKVGKAVSMFVLAMMCVLPLNAQSESGLNRHELSDPVSIFGKSWLDIPEVQGQKLLSDYRQKEKDTHIKNTATATPFSVQGKKVLTDADWIKMEISGGTVYKLAIDHDPASNIVYAMTKKGIYKSDNGGETWNHLLLGVIYESCDIQIAPTNSSIIYGLVGSILYMSNDAGATWTTNYVYDYWGSANCYALQIDSVDPTKVYVSGYGYREEMVDPWNPTPSRYYWLSVYISLNSGSSWETRQLSGEYWDPGGMGASGNLRFLSFVPGSDILFAAGTYFDGSTVVYKSLDRGENWTETFQYTYGYYGYSFNTFSIDPITGAILLGGDTIFRSTDSGESWAQVTPGIPTPIEASTFDQTGSLYAVSQGQVSQSIDQGDTWSSGTEFIQINSNNWVNDITVDPAHPTSIYIACLQGFYKSADGGYSYQEINKNFFARDVYDIAIDPIDPNIIYVDCRQNLCRSSDGGENWSTIGKPIDNNLDIVIDPLNHDIYLVGNYSSSIWRSQNDGKTWTIINLPGRVISLAIDPNDGFLYCGSYYYWYNGNYRPVVFKSSNHGATWSVLIPEATARGNITVLTMGAIANILYAGGYTYDSITGHDSPIVYRTADGGMTWSKWDINISFEDGCINDIAVTSNGKVVACGYAYDETNNYGFFSSTDGINWVVSCKSEGRSIASDPSSSFLIAAGSIYIPQYNYTYLEASIISSTDGGMTWKGDMSAWRYMRVVEVAKQNTTLTTYAISGNEPELFRSTRPAIPSSSGIQSVALAADAEWINRYAYAFDGKGYAIIGPEDDTPIPAWQGFWVYVNNSVDFLIPKDPDALIPASLDIEMIPQKWYLISSPLDPGPSNRDLSLNFSKLGQYEKTWRAVKWNYMYSGSSGTEGYMKYTGPTSGFPELLPGRGFWIKQINEETKTISISGTAVSPPGDYYELQLPVNGSEKTTAHMIGNPYGYPIFWKDMMVRKPSSGTAPIGKLASNPGSIEKWFVGIKLEALDGSAQDLYNRAGVVTTQGIDSKKFNAMDLIPPDSFVNVTLNDPTDKTRSGLAYDFRTVGQNEYQWELDLSTSYTSIPVRLSLDNLVNVPKEVQFTLKDILSGETIDVTSDRTLTLTLTSGTAYRYLLTAKMAPGSTTGADETHPLSFGLTGANPNPFNPSTTINFGVEKSGVVKLSVYNINGQRVDTLIEGIMTPGKHSVMWNAKGKSSGVYLMVLEANGKRDTMKVSLVK